LDKVHRQLSTATRTIEDTGTRTRAMERRLRAVEQMDPTESAAILALPMAGLGEIEADEADEIAEQEGVGAA